MVADRHFSMETSQAKMSPSSDTRTIAVQKLIRLLASLIADESCVRPGSTTSAQIQSHPVQAGDHREILSAIQDVVSTMNPESPIFATFHDGQVHDPLGGGSYAFQKDVVEPLLNALVNDEILSSDEKGVSTYKQDKPTTENQLPTRPIVIHAGAQPNNSPHAGTLVVFCYAFSLAQKIRSRMQAMSDGTKAQPPPVSVEVTFIDTAPVAGQEAEIDGIQYQKSHRSVAGALDKHMADYDQVLQLLSRWSGIPLRTASQARFFTQPTIPSILRYVIAHHRILGRQLSPKYGKIALRAACPIPGCGLAEKHGRLNVYNEMGNFQTSGALQEASDATITFYCPTHGPHTISVSNAADTGRLEANAPIRNLIRSMSQLLDTTTHHVRVTGADYAGTYQEVFLYRPLAAWSKDTGLAIGRTPHILYAPLIVDWSGAKLSKSLYVREGGYQSMKLFGTEGLCSFAQLKSRFGDDGEEGLKRLWDEVERWLEDPRKLFRTFSVEYLKRVVMEGERWS